MIWFLAGTTTAAVLAFCYVTGRYAEARDDADYWHDRYDALLDRVTKREEELN